MPVTLQGESLVLTAADVETLWRETIKLRHFPDETVTVRCVTVAEIRELNTRYRKTQKPTNVLTFSYEEGEHDIAVCSEVVAAEAAERGLQLPDYTALVLVHAFLHVTELDHEVSDSEAAVTREAERTILAASGYSAATL